MGSPARELHPYPGYLRVPVKQINGLGVGFEITIQLHLLENWVSILFLRLL